MSQETDMLTKWDDRIVALGNKLAELAEKHGPDVAEAALTIGRIDAASGLVFGFAALAGAAYGAWLVKESVVKASKVMKNGDDGIGWCFAALGSGVVTLFCGVGAAVNLLDIWRWVGVFEPQLWLAKKALGL